MAVSIDVDVTLEIELLNAPLATLAQEKDDMNSNSNSDIIKNVKSGIVALLGCLDGRFYFERVAD